MYYVLLFDFPLNLYSSQTHFYSVSCTAPLRVVAQAVRIIHPMFQAMKSRAPNKILIRPEPNHLNLYDHKIEHHTRLRLLIKKPQRYLYLILQQVTPMARKILLISPYPPLLIVILNLCQPEVSAPTRKQYQQQVSRQRRNPSG